MIAKDHNKFTKDQLFTLEMKRLDNRGRLVGLIVPYGALLFVAGCGVYCIHLLAGQSTMAQIGVSFLASIKVDSVIAYVFGGAGVAFGTVERRLRRRKTEDRAHHNQALEARLDPQRTSSGLTPAGTTRRDDQ